MGNLRFFEIAAQIIPFLFLALMVEVRAFEPRDRREVREMLVITLGVTIGLVAGEAAALEAVLRGRGTELGEDVIEVAMIAAAAQLIVMPLHRLLSAGEEDEEPDVRLRGVALAACAALAVGASLGVVVFDSA